MKKIVPLIIIVICLFISVTGIVTFFIVNNGSFLTSFKITRVNNIGLDYYVYFQNVKAATSYDVIVYDSENLIVYRENIKNNSLTINFDNLKYNETYKIVVVAYDKNGNKKSVKEPYTFMWEDLSLASTNTVLMDNENDYIVEFIGNYKKNKYYLNIKEDNDVIKSVRINGESYVIKNDLFKDRKTKYLLEIVEDSTVISSMYVYNLMSPITDINIINPGNGDMKDYDDVPLSFEGGDNATNYIFELYQNNKLIRRKEIKNKNIILSNNLFNKASTYVAKITASYADYIDYSKVASVEFTINAKESLKPVYTNYNYSLIKSGTEIELLNDDKDAIIYYTTDGSEPNQDSLVYKDKIVINNNMTIKAIAKKDKMNDSIVSSFDFKVGSKSNYKVYLSASNQNANLGVSEVGYTNEKKEMNDVANYIQKRLESYGVKVYRNEYGDLNRWVADSTYLGVDLHIAIHSNASEEHLSYGIETWVNEPDSKTYSLASKIQNNLMSIYYKKEDSLANRGVKYAYGSLGEVNPNYVPFGILVEVAHHDYKDDAKWIVDNKEKIGNNIADSILEYFQIK